MSQKINNVDLVLTKINVMKSFFESIGIEVIIFFAGLAGGVTSLTTKPKDMTRKQQLITVFAGGFAANYLTPLVAEWLNLSDKSLYGIAFLLGYSGMKSIEFAIKRMHKPLKQNIDGDL